MNYDKGFVIYQRHAYQIGKYKNLIEAKFNRMVDLCTVGLTFNFPPQKICRRLRNIIWATFTACAVTKNLSDKNDAEKKSALKKIPKVQAVFSGRKAVLPIRAEEKIITAWLFLQAARIH